MNVAGIIFSVFIILVIIFLVQWLAPNLYRKVLPNFNLTFGPINLLGDDSNRNPKETPNDNNGNSNNDLQLNYSGPRPETVISFGPEEGSKLTKEPEVVFRFKSIWSGNQDQIGFETKITGIDEEWVNSNSGEREIKLLAGNHSYSFQVRARTGDGIVDLSPAVRNFIGLLSLHLDKVQITSASSGSFGGSAMRVSLNNNSEENINITGWQIKGLYGVFSISQAVSAYNQFGGVSQNQDLVLEKNGLVDIFGDRSPLGINFRLNKCFGYLSKLYNFYYGLSSNCPQLQSSELSGFTPACYDYLFSLGSCEVPDANRLNSFAGDTACRSFANSRLNYNGCFNAHYQDEDFFSNEWHLFSGKNFIGERHDTLELFDKVGLFVGRYSY